VFNVFNRDKRFIGGMSYVGKKKDCIIAIRVTRETKERWEKILYEFKKSGLTAEDLFVRALDYLEDLAKLKVSSI